MIPRSHRRDDAEHPALADRVTCTDLDDPDDGDDGENGENGEDDECTGPPDATEPGEIAPCHEHS